MGQESGRIIRHGPGSPAWNMAVDEALLHLTTKTTLRLYSWTVPAVSLGYFQSCNLAFPNRPFVRRYTGGGLVDHTRDFTYTLASPRDTHLGSLSTSESYALIHRAIVQALQLMGLPAELTSCCEETEATGCFQKPVKFDVMLHDKKVAGAAQRRTRTALLQQGSILLPESDLYPALTTILPQMLAQEIGLEWKPSELTEEETIKAKELETARYSKDEWNRER